MIHLATITALVKEIRKHGMHIAEGENNVALASGAEQILQNIIIFLPFSTG